MGVFSNPLDDWEVETPDDPYYGWTWNPYTGTSNTLEEPVGYSNFGVNGFEPVSTPDAPLFGTTTEQPIFSDADAVLPGNAGTNPFYTPTDDAGMTIPVYTATNANPTAGADNPDIIGALNPNGSTPLTITPEQEAAISAANNQINNPTTPTSVLGQGGLPIPIPIPGIGWPEAIAGTLILNGGNLGIGGNSSPANLPGAIANVVKDPVGAITNTTGNVSDNILTNPGNIIFAPSSGGSSGTMGPSPTPTTTPTPTTPTEPGTGVTIVPGGSQGGSNETPSEGSGSTPIYPGANEEPVKTANVPSIQTTPGITNPEPVQTATTPVIPTQTTPGIPNPDSTPTTPTTPVVPTVPTVPTTPTPVAENPPTTTPTVPTTPSGTTPTTPSVIITPGTTTNTNLMATTYPQRNYYNEGNQSTTDLTRLQPAISGLYGDASKAYANADTTNLTSALQSILGLNPNTTTAANQQTTASNTALRQSNIGDVSSLASQALALQQQVNQPLYSSLGTLQTGAQNLVNSANALSSSAGYLSPEEERQAQQAAREAWAARGLVYSPGAVGAEILNRANLVRDRQQQAFTNQATAQSGLQGATAAQQANSFNPYSTILGSQYGQQTANVGTNQNLFSQSGQLSSGALGNQFVQQAFYPYNNYANNVYDTNLNAEAAAKITDANNAAALEAGRNVSTTNYANMFANALFGLGKSNGWFGGS